jgi:hypothetical protein
MTDIETTGTDAVTYAEDLAARGYEVVRIWQFTSQVNNYAVTDLRVSFAHGYAVSYSGQLRFADGTRAPHCAGVVIICDSDYGMPLGKLVTSGRALITMGGKIAPYYLASYNPRDTETRNDQTVNPGIFPQANMREVTADTWPNIPDGPHTYYDFRLTPAGNVPDKFNHDYWL